MDNRTTFWVIIFVVLGVLAMNLGIYFNAEQGYENQGTTQEQTTDEQQSEASDQQSDSQAQEQSQDQTQQVASPVTSYSSAQELAAATGQTIMVPQEATDVSYSSVTSGDEVIAQADYTYNGYQCNYRLASTAGFEDISGVYEDWSGNNLAVVGGDSWSVYWNGTAGVAQMYDKGVMHSLSVTAGGGVDQKAVVNALNAVAYQNK